MYNNSRSHSPCFGERPPPTGDEKLGTAADLDGASWQTSLPVWWARQCVNNFKRWNTQVCKTVPGAAQLQLLGVEQELEEEQQQAPTLPPSWVLFSFFCCWKTVIVRAPVVCPCLPPYNNTWNPGFGRCTINIASTQDSHRYLNFLTGPVTVKIPSGLSVFVRKFSNIFRQCQGSSELLRS